MRDFIGGLTRHTAVICVIKPRSRLWVQLLAIVRPTDIKRETLVVVVAVSVQGATGGERGAAVVVLALARSVCKEFRCTVQHFIV